MEMYFMTYAPWLLRNTTNKAIKVAQNKFSWAFIIQDEKKKKNLKRDDSKTLFNHCLLYMISLTEVGVKANAKSAFKT